MVTHGISVWLNKCYMSATSSVGMLRFLHISYKCMDNTAGLQCMDNTAGIQCMDNTAGLQCMDNTAGLQCVDNTEGLQ